MIHAIIIDGQHKNTVVRLTDYVPLLRIPIQSAVNFEECTLERVVIKEATYLPVFHAVDRHVVLYSVTGKSEELLNRDALHHQHPGMKAMDDVFGNVLTYFVKVEETHV